MLISVTIVICTSYIAITLFYISQKHILLEQEKKRITQEELDKTYPRRIEAKSFKNLMYESFAFHFIFLFPLLILVLTLLTFWGYEIFNWLIKL